MNARARGNANKTSNIPAGRGRGAAPRETSPKRPRISTSNVVPTLPPAYRRPPKIEATKAYMFKGLHPLYTRHNIKNSERWHKYIEIRCGQPGCTSLEYKEIERNLSGTNNYKVHY
ncbi:hypothetical protein IFR05_016799, partial [Cadophora sp. M221]